MLFAVLLLEDQYSRLVNLQDSNFKFVLISDFVLNVGMFLLGDLF